MFKKYTAANVREMTGYNFNEFIQLPYARMNSLLTYLLKEDNLKMSADKKALDKLQKEIKG